MSGPLKLRTYQVDLADRFAAEVSTGRRRVLVEAPTGAGKTVIAAEIVRRERGPVLFLAHRKELVEQAVRKLWAAGIDSGIIKSGHPMRPGERVQVASVQTLWSRAFRGTAIEPPPAGLVVVDEAHRATARTYRKILEAYPGAAVLGLTATPCRGDGRGLGADFDVILNCPPIAELQRLGFLVQTRVYAPTRPDLSGVKVERGDYVERGLAKVMDRPELVGDVVEHWLRLAERRPTVVFATGVGHSLHLAREFNRVGVLAEHVDADTPPDDRERILKGLAAGTVDVVTNAMVLTEGWDCPEAACVVLARPTRQLGLYRQMVGRGMRPAPGKPDLLILDHAGTVFAHGFPEDPIEWTLHPDRRATNPKQRVRESSSAQRLTNCPECSAVRTAGEACPACGWRPRAKPNAVEVADGELGRVGPDRKARGATRGADDQKTFYRELLAIAREKGYRRGWAAHKYREKFSEWPPRGWNGAAPIEASDATRAWVRSRQIAFAKAMEKVRRSA